MRTGKKALESKSKPRARVKMRKAELYGTNYFFSLLFQEQFENSEGFRPRDNTFRFAF